MKKLLIITPVLLASTFLISCDSKSKLNDKNLTAGINEYLLKNQNTHACSGYLDLYSDFKPPYNTKSTSATAMAMRSLLDAKLVAIKSTSSNNGESYAYYEPTEEFKKYVKKINNYELDIAYNKLCYGNYEVSKINKIGKTYSKDYVRVDYEAKVTNIAPFAKNEKVLAVFDDIKDATTKNIETYDILRLTTDKGWIVQDRSEYRRREY